MKLRIKELAQARGINQTQLMYSTRVSPDTMNRYWHSTNLDSVSFKVLKRFADFFEVKVTDLIAEESEEASIH